MARSLSVSPEPRSALLDDWVKRFAIEGMERLFGHKSGRPVLFAAGWVAVAVVIEWVTEKVPRDFGSLP